MNEDYRNNFGKDPDWVLTLEDGREPPRKRRYCELYSGTVFRYVDDIFLKIDDVTAVNLSIFGIWNDAFKDDPYVEPLEAKLTYR